MSDSGDGLRFETTIGVLRAAAARRPEAEAVVELSEAGRTVLTYAELAERAHAAGRAMLAAGVQTGDRVAIWAPNCPEWIVALLGIHAAGGVLVPLNTRYKGMEAADILERSRARVLLTVEGFLGNDYVTMLDEAGRPDSLEQVVVLRGERTPPAGTRGFADFLADGEGVAPELLEERVSGLGPDTLSDLLFTSGTTGRPKGVMCTHGQTVRAFADWAAVVGLRAGDRYLVINPFFHAFGYKAGIVAALATGATLIPLPVFDVPAAMATIEAEGITMLPGPPTLYQTILGHPGFDPSRLSSLRLAVTGAAVVPVQLVRDMRDVLGFDTVITGYGLTEACGIATMCRHDDDPETIALTAGRAIPGVEVAVVDEDGRHLPSGEAGEVVVRGYNVMLGYFEDPEATARTIDGEGWLHTGDIGVLDDRGYLRITDRLKDMFIVGGFNAYPAEIEQLLLAHPDIAQVSVVGVPDERMGEVGFAFVVPRGGVDLQGGEVVAWAREHMANYKAPRHAAIVDVLPVNAGGKVMKFQLKDEALAALAADATGGRDA